MNILFSKLIICAVFIGTVCCAMEQEAPVAKKCKLEDKIKVPPILPYRQVETLLELSAKAVAKYIVQENIPKKDAINRLPKELWYLVSAKSFDVAVGPMNLNFEVQIPAEYETAEFYEALCNRNKLQTKALKDLCRGRHIFGEGLWEKLDNEKMIKKLLVCTAIYPLRLDAALIDDEEINIRVHSLDVVNNLEKQAYAIELLEFVLPQSKLVKDLLVSSNENIEEEIDRFFFLNDRSYGNWIDGLVNQLNYMQLILYIANKSLFNAMLPAINFEDKEQHKRVLNRIEAHVDTIAGILNYQGEEVEEVPDVIFNRYVDRLENIAAIVNYFDQILKDATFSWAILDHYKVSYDEVSAFFNKLNTLITQYRSKEIDRNAFIEYARSITEDWPLLIPKS